MGKLSYDCKRLLAVILVANVTKATTVTELRGINMAAMIGESKP